MQRVRPAEGLRDTAHVGALRAWGARNDLDVVALSPLELGEVRHVRLNPAKPGQVEVADVRDFHNLRTLNNEPPPGWTTHMAQGYVRRDPGTEPTPGDQPSEGAAGRDPRVVVRETIRRPVGDSRTLPPPTATPPTSRHQARARTEG